MADGTRTHDPQIHNLVTTVANVNKATDLQRGDILVAQGVAQETQKSTPEAVAMPADVDPELAAVVAAWPDLPEPIRRAIRAMVEAGK